MSSPPNNKEPQRPTTPSPITNSTSNTVDDLVAACIERMEGADESVVDQVCSEHPELAEQIRAQLEQLRGLGLLQTASPPPATTPKTLGPYTILSELGRGGMGVVYLAEQREPVQRRVAIKLARGDAGATNLLRRFELERQALAAMDHPGIARILDSNRSDTGQAYFVMEFVAGLPITTYCNRGELTTKERVQLFLQVCDAVEHAHQRGILHRDLKPTNVLVSEREGKHLVKIIDFGIAKVVRPELGEGADLTLPGQVVGTPEYMSPEQVASCGQDIDTRTDIYSLGVLLYELLCGELPFEAHRLRSVSPIEMHGILRSETPPSPSTRTGTHALTNGQGSDPAALRRQLRGDLDWITLCAIEPERERRYSSAQALGSDLRRHLRNEPVLAGPPTLRYRFGKLIRRHRVAFAATAAVMIAFIFALATSIGSAMEAHQKGLAFDQLAAFLKVDDAIASQASMVPAWPENIPVLRQWVTSVGPVVGMPDRLRKTIEQIAQRPETPAADTATTVNFRGEAQGSARATLFADLLTKIEKFQSEEYLAVTQRLWWAEHIDEWTRSHPRARTTWEQARDAIAKADGLVASELYKHSPIDLQPEHGLIPIGMNPKTKLWEFYHLRSAWTPGKGVDPSHIEIPSHAAETGTIPVSESTGIIFVLIPQSEPSSAKPSKSVGPMFIARHEMTQAQWLRLSGQNPSQYYPVKSEPFNLTHPVECVRWQESRDLLAMHGLSLPSEPLWEYACRAGTTTPWFSGAELQSLRRVANVFDASGVQNFSAESWNDGYPSHAPVGSFEPNRFGLFDTHGNVWEWCDIGPDTLQGTFPTRGGGWMHKGLAARSSVRMSQRAAFQKSDIGVRAVRPLSPQSMRHRIPR